MSERESNSAHAGHLRLQAIQRVFALFATRWPKAFSPDTQRLQANVWRMSTERFPHEVLYPAAERYLANVGGIAPDAPKFSAFVQRLLDEREARTARPEPARRAPRRFWYAKPGPAAGWGRIDAEKAVATEIPGQGFSGIADADFDKVQAGTLDWGWLPDGD